MLRSQKHGDKRMLAECTVLGRAPGCDLRLGAAQASAEHAVIRWVDQRWHVVDLGSRNGTWLDGRPLQGAQSALLSNGTVLCFGSLEETWELCCELPPLPFIRSPTHDLVLAELLSLPTPEAPQVEIICSPDGHWYIEDQEGRRAAIDREAYRAGDQWWRIFLPSNLPRTDALGAAMADARVEIEHDPIEEHIAAKFYPAIGPSVDLGCRAHHVVLLELARVRLEDRTAGVNEAGEGWVHRDELSRRLHVEVAHINIMVHRLRRQLLAKQVIGGADVVERRPRSGMLRIGPRDVVVSRMG